MSRGDGHCRRLPGGGGSQERTRLWGGPNSLLAGKIQGISSTLASVARICRQNHDYNQSFTSKFPAQQNRELIRPYQGIKSAYQGSFLPDQGRALGWGFSKGESGKQ